MIYQGFDTSNYTTSVAALDDSGEYENIRSILPVKQGERGIRQSDGLFLHTKNIGALYERLKIDFKKTAAAAVSVRPRNVEGSYMPVFLAGEAFARGVAHSLGVPLYEVSHQDGHIAAGIFSGNADELLDGEFLSVHLSGGTTEILKTKFNGAGFDNEIIGGTEDISAGQFIDRTGVYLGLPFPCGKELERLALGTVKSEIKGTLKLPVCERNAYICLSGVETKIKGMVNCYQPQLIARAVLENVAEALSRAINSAIKKTGTDRILIVGGVASNSILRERFKQKIHGRLFFASGELSTYNAVGTAWLARAIHERGRLWNQE